jgi:flagellar biosynthesis anti-sigma factor FlgM
VAAGPPDGCVLQPVCYPGCDDAAKGVDITVKESPSRADNEVEACALPFEWPSMADEIRKHVRTATAITLAAKRGAKQANPSNETGKPQRALRARHCVKLSGQVHVLRAAEAGLRGQPDVDEERVAKLRARVSSGDYEVHAERVTAKLLHLEQALG